MHRKSDNLCDRVAEKEKIPRSVQVNPEGWPVLDRVAEELGVGKNQLVTRLLVFFDRLSRRAQKELLDKNGDVIAELLAERLGDLASTGGQAVHGMSHDQCAAAVRVLLDRMSQIDAARVRELNSGKSKSK